MTKLSLSASRILVGFSMAVVLNNTALAENVTIKNIQEFRNNFQNSDDGTWKIKNEKNIKDLTLSFEPGAIPFITNLNIKVSDNVNLQGENDDYMDLGAIPTNVARYDYYGFNFEAKNVNINNEKTTIEVNKPSNIIGNLNITPNINDNKDIISNLQDDFPSLEIFSGFGERRSGKLNIKGDLKVNQTMIEINDINRKGGLLTVDGKADITHSGFSVATTDLKNLDYNNFELVYAGGGFNNDILTSNQTRAILYRDIAELFTNSKLPKNTYFEGAVLLGFTDYKLSLSQDGKRLYLSGGSTDKVKDIKSILLIEQAIREGAIETLELIVKDAKTPSNYERPGYIGNEAIITATDETVTELKTQVNEVKQQIEQIEQIDESGESDSAKTNFLINSIATNIPTVDKNLAGSILQSLLKSTLKNNDIASITLDIKSNLKPIVDGIKQTSQSITNSNSTTGSIISTINVSNDVFIGSRLAMLNNPHRTYASKLAGVQFAAIKSDIRADYINDYSQNFWSNVFGGVNIIDGNNGAIYGTTIGVDKQANDNILWGTYLTYANAKIKDEALEQKSNNIQVGFYSNIILTQQWELNAKSYIQVSPTNQNTVLNQNNHHADYMRKFFGLSANIGRTFNFSGHTVLIKPFVGGNYYYAYTPNYEETGTLAKQVESISNSSISLEFGAELRKYLNESSYIFAIPRIEQYLINNGSDFTAKFLGSNTNFSVDSDNKKKTYGQIIVGGNVDFTNRLSANLGFGAKQIFAGKTANKNETYLSGQVGLKYKF